MGSVRHHASVLFLAGLLTVALTGCASSGGTQASSPPASGAAAAATSKAGEAGKAGEAAKKSPGFFTKILQSVGLHKKSDAKLAVNALPLRIYTATNLNSGRNPHGIALVLKVYHLRSLAQFQQMNFDNFLDDKQAQAKLGSSLIDSRQMLLLPGKQYISTEELPEGTDYIGFVALFRGPAPQRWRFAYNAPESAKSGITMGIHGCAMSSTSGALMTQLDSKADSLSGVQCPDPGQ